MRIGSLKARVAAWAARAIISVERFVRGRDEEAPESVTSVLVLEYLLPLGCCVHLTPLFEAIKQRRPGVTVTVATCGLAADLLRHHPGVDHLIVTPDALVDTLGAVRVLRRELRRLGLTPDCVLTGASDRRRRITLLGMLACDGWRGGWAVTPQLLHRPLEYDRGRSLIENNLRLAALVGGDGGHREPGVYFSVLDEVRAEKMLKTAGGRGRPVLAMATQNGGRQRTGWHVARFAEVARFACQELGYAVVYVGTAADAGAIDALRAMAGVGVSLAGRTSVPTLAAVLALSDALVSLDTGTMHVGRSVGVPMVVIGPCWQKPLEWLPLGLPQVRIVRGEDRTDVPADYRLDEVQAIQVKDALRELTAAYPASKREREKRVLRRVSRVDHATVSSVSASLGVVGGAAEWTMKGAQSRRA
jgi:ADP-heptose:LPS heptosyltransferase